MSTTSRALEAIGAEAARLRRANPSLTAERATAQVLRGRPDLYDAYNAEADAGAADEVEVLAVLDEWGRRIAEDAARALCALHPAMTHEQAMAKVFGEMPELYDCYLPRGAACRRRRPVGARARVHRALLTQSCPGWPPRGRHPSPLTGPGQPGASAPSPRPAGGD